MNIFAPANTGGAMVLMKNKRRTVMELRKFFLSFGLMPKEELTEEDIENMSFRDALRYYDSPEEPKD